MTPADRPAPARNEKATPGPWEARGDHAGVWHRYKSGVKDMVHFVALASVSIPRRRKEVSSYHEGIREMNANAALIAAAPTMAQTIEWTLGRLGRAPGGICCVCAEPYECNDLCAVPRLRLALAAAKGGEK